MSSELPATALDETIEGFYYGLSIVYRWIMIVCTLNNGECFVFFDMFNQVYIFRAMPFSTKP